MPSLLGRCGGGSFAPLQGIYNAPNLSVAGLGGFDNAAWTYQSGDAVLDLTTPALPTAVTTGLYLFNLTWFVTGGGVAGRSFEGNIQIGTPFFRNMESYILNPSDGSGIGGHNSDAVVMTAGETVRLHYVNNDNGAHNFSIREAHVVFIAT